MPEQPDSKPSNVPGDNATPSPSNAYTPTTPASNSPTVNPNPEEATDPKDVPVPTDDDEFVAEDYWLVQKDKPIRVHQKPRYEAFDPSTCCDCPVDILCVSGERFSTGNASQQDLWSHQDTWDKNDSTWQIATLIEIENTGLYSPDVDVLHVENSQGGAFEVFFAQEDMDAAIQEHSNLPVFSQKTES